MSKFDNMEDYNLVVELLVSDPTKTLKEINQMSRSEIIQALSADTQEENEE